MPRGIYKRRYKAKRPNMSIYAASRKGKKAAHWEGGVVFIGGRMWLYNPSHPNAQYGHRYVAKSRYVMAKHLKRPLKSSEIVHHIDGDFTNDSLSNLIIVTRRGHNSIHKANISKHTRKLERLAALKRTRNQKGQFV